MRRIEVPVQRAKRIGSAENRCLDHRIIIRIFYNNRRCAAGVDHFREVVEGLGILLNLFRRERLQRLQTGISENTLHFFQ